MDTTLNWVANFIWGIADDVLRDLYVRGKYRDVILPMTVLRRLDAVLAHLDAPDSGQPAVGAGFGVEVHVLARLQERAVGVDRGDDRRVLQHQELSRAVLLGERQLAADSVEKLELCRR